MQRHNQPRNGANVELKVGSESKLICKHYNHYNYHDYYYSALILIMIGCIASTAAGTCCIIIYVCL